MAQPDWFIVIEQWVPRRMGHNGVTLPFLVGALDFKAGQRGRLDAHDVRQVLDEIVERPIEGYVTEVSWCFDIDAPVLNTKRVSAADRMKASVAFARPDGTGEAFVFAPNLQSRWGRD